ncbi:RecX family transcriptional regulator [Candidatus Saccharibacteria bacterium]|nr:RecX family transcriptional regulator [Candidatus Saccharibacteria bacterium]
MEIINLSSDSDAVLKPKAKESEPKNQITDLKSGVKNPNRVNVFLDDKFSFSLDISQVVDYHLKIGAILTDAELSELKHASAYGKLYGRTLEWVLTRPRSIKETRDHLREKRFAKKLDYTDVDIEEIINKLVEKNYLSDRTFAEWFIENRFVKKGVSRRRLEQELMKKGIERDLISELLNASSRDESEEIKKMIEKKSARYDDEKLLAYLVRQGFPYDLSRELIEESKVQNPAATD